MSFDAAGLSRAGPVERLMRDAKAFRIYDGTSRIQKRVIGRRVAELVPWEPQRKNASAYWQKLICRPSLRLKPALPAGSRYQNWNFQVSPGLI